MKVIRFDLIENKGNTWQRCDNSFRRKPKRREYSKGKTSQALHDLLSPTSTMIRSYGRPDRLKGIAEDHRRHNYMKILAELTKEKRDLPYEFLKISFALERIVRRNQSPVSQLSK
ncbi:MAG TPA: hypothetical protein VN227_08175 [Methanoregula sp.]|nr:hypothetical protein [Methanoregula sp.]